MRQPDSTMSEQRVPPGVEARVRRILKREARRLLAEELETEPLTAEEGATFEAMPDHNGHRPEEAR